MEGGERVSLSNMTTERACVEYPPTSKPPAAPGSETNERSVAETEAKEWRGAKRSNRRPTDRRAACRFGAASLHGGEGPEEGGRRGKSFPPSVLLASTNSLRQPPTAHQIKPVPSASPGKSIPASPSPPPPTHSSTRWGAPSEA